MKDGHFWVVIDETGEPDYCASRQELCHEHREHALEVGIEEARLYQVKAAVLEGTDAAEMRRLLAYLIDHSNAKALLSEGYIEDVRAVLARVNDMLSAKA